MYTPSEARLGFARSAVRSTLGLSCACAQSSEAEPATKVTV